jgi:hypothetical protein
MPLAKATASSSGGTLNLDPTYLSVLDFQSDPTATDGRRHCAQSNRR